MTIPTDPEPSTRSPDERARDRQARLDHTWEEVRRIVAEYHARLPRDHAVALGAAYARYSSRHQDSVPDQIRAIFEDAFRKKLFIPLENVYFDLAVRGVKADRPGLNALRACLAGKAVQVVLFFATNRLFRKTYRSLQFVEEQIVERGIRAVFVKSGVDTIDGKRWRSLLNMNASMDEFVVGMYVDNIRAAHEGLLEKQHVFGTISFGYTGDIIPGVLTRRGRPRKALVIDLLLAEWVRTIFRWYVIDRVPIAEIVRRLNADPTVPPPPKSPRGEWSRLSVITLLRNPRYRGCWRYGVTETVWISSKDYARQVNRREPLKEIQIEALRIVPDDTWHAAQSLLAREVARVVGRKPRDEDAAKRPRLLNGLFVCPTHDRRLYVGGAHGQTMFCPDCQKLPTEERALFSLLPRDVALQKTCDALVASIRNDDDLVRKIADACRRHAAAQQAPDPSRLASLAARGAKLDRQIGFILRNSGETEADQAESTAELRRLRQERSDVRAESDALQAAANRAIVLPTEDEVRAMLAQLTDILSSAASATGEGAGRVRALFEVMTGGRIELMQMGERKAHRGWLRGRFPDRLVPTITHRLTGVPIGANESDTLLPEVVIDYRRDPDELPASVVAEIVSLYQSGALVKEVARRLGLNRNAVAKALDDWFARQGLQRPDGRTRRSTLAIKHLELPQYQALADRVKVLADQGRHFGEIATELDVDRNTVTSAWKHWHASRGLPVLDGRTRRTELPRQNRPR